MSGFQYELIAADAMRRKALAWGWGSLAVAVVAGIISLSTYSAASSDPNGGSYFIWWGPIVFGLIASVRNFSRAAKIKAALAATVAEAQRLQRQQFREQHERKQDGKD